MVIVLRYSLLLSVLLAAGCGEWTAVMLHKPGTRQEAACVKDRGNRLPPDQVERVRQCILACQAQGFELDDPKDLPPPREGLPSTVRPWVPEICQAPSSDSTNPATGGTEKR